MGEWLLQNIIIILAGTVLFMLLIWCFCSVYAQEKERKSHDKRRDERQSQESEELKIQTKLLPETKLPE